MNLQIINRYSKQVLSHINNDNKRSFGLAAGKLVEKVALAILEENKASIHQPRAEKVINHLKDHGHLPISNYLQMRCLITFRNYCLYEHGDMKDFDRSYQKTKAVFIEFLKWLYKEKMKNKGAYYALINPGGETHPTEVADSYGLKNYRLIEKNDLIFNLIDSMSKQMEELKPLVEPSKDGEARAQEIIALQESVRGIKDSHFAKEGKASLIYSLLDEILVEEQELKEYESSQSWLAFDWGNLEETSQLSLVRADSLFEEFNKIPESDYSSLILEYFRSLEIELFFKIFHPYAEDVRRKKLLIEENFPEDLKTTSVAKHFAKGLNEYLYHRHKKDWTLDFDTMATSLDLATETEEINSGLLTNFKGFLERIFTKDVTELAFLKEVKKINEDIRKPAAHIYSIHLEDAKKGREKLREIFNQFFQAYQS